MNEWSCSVGRRLNRRLSSMPITEGGGGGGKFFFFEKGKRELSVAGVDELFPLSFLSSSLWLRRSLPYFLLLLLLLLLSP